GTTIDTQRLAQARNQKQQADSSGFHDIAQTIEASIARSIRQNQRLRVQHFDPARGLAARRNIAASVPTVSADQNKGRLGNEGNHVLVECRQLLLSRQLARYT